MGAWGAVFMGPQDPGSICFEPTLLTGVTLVVGVPGEGEGE